MNQEQANHLFDHLGVLILLDSPEKIQLGIDNTQWVIGNKFKGIKLIPLGVHFVHYSLFEEKYQFKLGFFCTFTKQKLIVVKRWNSKLEDFISVDADELQSYENAYRIRDLDPYLGLYPHEKANIWAKVSNYITQEVLDKLDPIVPQLYQIEEEYQRSKSKQQKQEKSLDDQLRQDLEESNSGSDSEPGDLFQQGPDVEKQLEDDADLELGNKDPLSFDMDAEISDSEDNQQRNQNQGSRNADEIRKEVQKNNTKGDFQAISGTIYYTDIPQRKFQHKVQGTDLTQLNFDKSQILMELIEKSYNSKFSLLLGEFQYSFIRFLLGENYDSFEQWKKIFILLCSCEKITSTKPEYLTEMIPVLYDQLQQVPQDFFIDPLSSSNFIVSCLKNLYEICIGNYSGERRRLSLRVQKLQEMVQMHFFKNPQEYNENDEDGPLIVQDFDFVQI